MVSQQEWRCKDWWKVKRSLWASRREKVYVAVENIVVIDDGSVNRKRNFKQRHQQGLVVLHLSNCS